jgi:hypothetical protein
MASFKIGDKLRCIDNASSDFKINEVYTAAIDSYIEGGYQYVDLVNHTGGWLTERFELVESAAVVDPEIDLQWIPEKQLFIIDGVEITVEALKQLVHNVHNIQKTEKMEVYREPFEDNSIEIWRQ